MMRRVKFDGGTKLQLLRITGPHRYDTDPWGRYVKGESWGQDGEVTAALSDRGRLCGIRGLVTTESQVKLLACLFEESRKKNIQNILPVDEYYIPPAGDPQGRNEQQTEDQRVTTIYTVSPNIELTLKQVVLYVRESGRLFTELQLAAILGQVVHPQPSLPKKRTDQVQVLNGLGFLSANGLRHREISPENILLKGCGIVFIGSSGHSVNSTRAKFRPQVAFNMSSTPGICLPLIA